MSKKPISTQAKWSSKHITQAQRDELVRRWVEEIALSTVPMTEDDFVAVEAALSRIFAGKGKLIIRFNGFFPASAAADAAARADADAAAAAADAASDAAADAAAAADADRPIYRRSSMWIWNRVYCAFAEMCGWKGDWSDQKTIATRCGGLLFGARTIWVYDRPRILKTTGAPRYLPHCADGPWLRYANGQEDYAIDGLRVPKKVVMAPENQTIAEIDGERNNDVRSVRLARFGLGRYLEETGATVLDERHEPITNTHESLLRTARGDVYFWPTCPSGKPCPPLLIPSTITTCEAASRWLAGDRPKTRIVART